MSKIILVYQWAITGTTATWAAAQVDKIATSERAETLSPTITTTGTGSGADVEAFAQAILDAVTNYLQDTFGATITNPQSGSSAGGGNWDLSLSLIAEVEASDANPFMALPTALSIRGSGWNCLDPLTGAAPADVCVSYPLLAADNSGGGGGGLQLPNTLAAQMLVKGLGG